MPRPRKTGRPKAEADAAAAKAKPTSPRPTGKSKAAKPEVTPLGEHLAALLNPALNVPKQSSTPPSGFEEGQARFDHGGDGPVSRIDRKLETMFGLAAHDDLDSVPATRPPVHDPDAAHPRGMTGATATADSLAALLVAGDPNIQKGMAWTPHRPDRPDKSEGGITFELVSEYEPKGDQPTAIEALVAGVSEYERDQVLLGVTGSGKTFTMAQVISRTNRPALILAPNKTLAAQLYGEFKSFFPNNAVEYFVSYYDYYQPEAYVPRTDTYIEKESSINEQIDRMRHAATRSLLERDDVIIVASVSCIYGIGSVETYTAMTFTVRNNEKIDQRQLIADLVALQYKRSGGDFSRGVFRVRGDTVELFPAHYEDRAWRVSFFGDEVEGIVEFDPLTGKKTQDLDFVKIYANSHYVTPRPTLLQSIKGIKGELKQRLDELYRAGRLLEAQRLEQRTLFDLEMMEATGSCAGIENYSRYLTGRKPGEPPPTCSSTCPTTRSSSPTNPTSPCRRSAACTAATSAQGHARRIRLPPALVHGQPPAALRGMGGDAAADGARLRHARHLGDGAHRRRLRRAGHPPDRPDRPAGGDPPGAQRRSTTCSTRSSRCRCAATAR